MIELLESRIAPASVFTYTDVDGDKVIVTVSKGGPSDLSYSLVGPGNAFGNELQKIDLKGNAVFSGANITLTATPQKIGGVLRGDGHVDLGFIDATGIPLGAVTVPGDLAKLTAGDGASPLPGVKTLTVGSLGARGTETGAPDVNTTISGKLGAAKIAGDLLGYLYASGGIDSVSVGGNIIGGGAANTGSIYTMGDLGPVTVKGDIRGGDLSVMLQ